MLPMSKQYLHDEEDELDDLSPETSLPTPTTDPDRPKDCESEQHSPIND